MLTRHTHTHRYSFTDYTRMIMTKAVNMWQSASSKLAIRCQPKQMAVQKMTDAQLRPSAGRSQQCSKLGLAASRSPCHYQAPPTSNSSPSDLVLRADSFPKITDPICQNPLTVHGHSQTQSCNLWRFKLDI